MLGLLSATWKVSIEDTEGVLKCISSKKSAHITTFWHRYLLCMLCIFRGYPVCVPVSRHNDGEYVAHIMHRYGLLTARGSTTRGSLSMIREMVRHINAGRSCAITPDGPRGPKYSVQPGFILLARRSGAPVHPIGIAVSGCWTFHSWDELVVPKPFARIRVVIGKGLTIPPRRGRNTEYYRRLVQEQMIQCSKEAARYQNASDPGAGGC